MARSTDKRMRLAIELSPALRRRIESAAARQKVSIGDYVLTILDRGVPPDEPGKGPPDAQGAARVTTPNIPHADGTPVAVGTSGPEIVTGGEHAGTEHRPVMPDVTDIEALAAQQGVSPISNFDDLLGDFWPEDESADDFIAAVREWRREGEGSR